MPGMLEPNAVVVLVYGVNTSPDALLPLDRLQIRQESTYVTLQDESGDALSHLNIGQANILSVASFLSGAKIESYDLLFVPGTRDAAHVAPEAAGDAIQRIFHDRMTAIVTGNARIALAASGLLRGRVASSNSLQLTDTYIEHARAWDAETRVVRDGGLWTANDDPETLTTLAILYKASRHYTIGGVFPRSVWNKYFGGSDDGRLPPTSSVPTSRTSGDDLAAELAGISLSDDSQEIADLIFHFAIRLALEGYVNQCNSLLTSLFIISPNAMESLGAPCMRPIEFIWESLDARPAVPWNSPSREDLDQWDREYRTIHHLPPDEDRKDILESIKLRISMSDDWLLTPYTLSGAVVMALDAGWHDQAREWMLKLVQDAYDTDSNHVWASRIARWRPLAHFCKSGIVAEVTGRTPDQADHDAETVKRAINSLRPSPTTSRTEQRDSSMPRFADRAWDVLVPMLDVLKWEQHETLLKPPASSAAIRDTEERLGITLPEDYKQFLLVSNGIEFMPSIDAPGFRAIEALKWETAEELGLDEFRVDLGCKTDPGEYERLPKMARVLVISDDSEETVWFVDPATVTEAIHVLRDEGRSDDVTGQPGWRAVFGANYLTELEWLPSFRGYMERLAEKAEKAAAK